MKIQCVFTFLEIRHSRRGVTLRFLYDMPQWGCEVL